MSTPWQRNAKDGSCNHKRERRKGEELIQNTFGVKRAKQDAHTQANDNVPSNIHTANALKMFIHTVASSVKRDAVIDLTQGAFYPWSTPSDGGV